MKVRNNYIPDVLDCLANLSSDEVFTPPIVVNKMLDMLPQELFASKETTFLDPFSKSGVFLREITKRLLENQIPNYKRISSEIEFIEKGAIQEAVRSGELDLNDSEYEKKAKAIGLNALDSHENAIQYKCFEDDLQEALNHILTKQVYGIAITELTAQLTRRSLYCSKDAACRYSVCTDFGINTDGNIRFVPMRHTWKNNTCIYCGASAGSLDRPNEFESHAYEFIHKDIDKLREEMGNMEFTVICGNPPYQLNVGQEKENYAVAIYDKFVIQAQRLNPKYLTMIIPSRWFAGGRGLDGFRDKMLHDKRIRIIHDFPNAADVFPGVQIKAGVCYFLWERDNEGNCDVTTHMNNEIIGPTNRPLLESGCDTFIRYNQSISVLKKVRGHKEKSFSEYVSAQTPFGVVTSYKGSPQKTKDSDVKMYISGNDKMYKGGTAYCPSEKITKGHDMIAWNKVYIGEAGSGSDSFPHLILSKPFYGEPNSMCNQSYLVIGPFKDKKECDNVISYIKTKFFRFMVLMKKNAQHAMRGVYQFVPIQDFSKPWTDKELYTKYDLSDEEIDFIESMIKPME